VADTVPNPLIAVRLLDVSATRALTDAARRRADRVASLLLEQSPMCRAAQVGGSFAKDTARQNTHSVDLFVAMSQRGLLTRRGRSYKPSTVVRQLYEVLSDAFEGHIQRGTVRLRRRTRSVHVVGPLRILSADDVAVRVVPALWDGNQDGVMQVPVHDANRWALTSPRRQVELLESYRSKVPAVCDAIRLAHMWNTRQKLAFRPFALETLALVASHELHGRTDPIDAEAIFDRMLRLVTSVRLERGLYVPNTFPPSEAYGERPDPVGIFDPTVRDNNLTHYLTTRDREKAREAAKAALSDLGASRRAVEGRDVVAARRHLALVLG